MSLRASTCPEKTVLTSVLLSWLLVTCSRGSRLFPITSMGGEPSAGLDDNMNVGIDQLGNDGDQFDLDNQETENATMRCDDARLRCAYRTGCGNALQHYLTRCASVLHGDVKTCPEICQHALIALTSTDEGKELMKCECAENDRLCHVSKQRAEICRSSVTTTMNRTRVSCRVATWICNADTICSTALQYYNENCKRMFHGKKCTKRCRNSLSILRRQEKAAKLNTCFCDGAEEYDCKSIHRNMNTLCYGKVYREYQQEPGDLGSSQNPRITRTQDDQGNRSTPHSTAPSSWTILLLCLVLMLLQSVHLARD